MDRCGEHSSRADDDLKVGVVGLRNDGFVVQVIQDVHSRYLLPVVLWRQSLIGGGRGKRHVDRKQVILKHVTFVGAIFLLQQRQQLQPADERRISEVRHL